MAVPNIFGTATSAIPLSQLDTNFATPVTIGNTAVQLGNTVTSFGNVTLTNVTISSGNVTVTGANVSGTANVSTLVVTGNQTSLGNVAITGNISANIATFGAGSNTAPAITTTGDTNTGMFFPAADTIAFAEGGAEAMRIDSSGNVGIGTSSPSQKLDVVGTSRYTFGVSNAYTIQTSLNAGGSSFADDYKNALSHIWQTSGTERMRIDSSGNVGIGTSSPGSFGKLAVTASSGVIGNFESTQSATNANLLNLNATQTNSSAGIRLQINSGTTAQGRIQLSGDSSIVFQQTSSDTERARIDSSGNLLIGYTSSNGSYKLQVNSQIFATSATIATSDGRYKKDIESLDGSLGLVTQLNPIQFSWKQHPVHAFDTSTPTIGFIAQEVQQVLADKPYLNSIIKANECVIEPEEKDEDGNVTKEAVTEEFLGIAEGNMIALLTKALQELNSKFEAYVATHP